jgi:hypothetical protein
VNWIVTTAVRSDDASSTTGVELVVVMAAALGSSLARVAKVTGG